MVQPSHGFPGPAREWQAGVGREKSVAPRTGPASRPFRPQGDLRYAGVPILGPGLGIGLYRETKQPWLANAP